MIRTFGQKIIVRREKADDKTAGGIILPNSVVDAPQDRCVVLAVGDKAKHIKVGDRILLSKFVGIGFQYQGEDLLVLNADEIIGVLPEAGA